MVRSRFLRVGALGSWALALLMVTLHSDPRCGPGLTTATVRGTVQDSQRRRAARRDRHPHQQRHEGAADRGHRRSRPVPLRRRLPGDLRPQGRALGVQDLRAKALVLSPNDSARHRREARSRPADRDDHGHRAAGSDPDGDGRARRRPEREADRQPVGHRPQRARTAAHPARRRHRLQPGRVGRASAAAPTTPRTTRSTASGRRRTPSRSTART